MSKQHVLFILVLIAILLIVGWFAWQSLTQDPTDGATSTPAAAALLPNTSSTQFTNLQGEPQNLEAKLGSVVVVHSWATWVPTSPASLKDLSDLQLAYADEGVSVLAINRSEPRATALRFLQQVDVTNLTVLADDDDQFYQAVGGQTMPETLFYNAAGDVVHHAKRPLSYAELERNTAAALRSTVDEQP